MRTLRYLGVLKKTCLIGVEADKFLEILKSMPEVLGVQEENYLLRYGINLKLLKKHSRQEVLDWLKSVGRNYYISEKTKSINNESQRRKKIRELILRLGETKVIFNLDVDEVTNIISKFSRFRAYNELIGFRKYCNILEENGIRIEAKFVNGKEYFIITKKQ